LKRPFIVAGKFAGEYQEFTDTHPDCQFFFKVMCGYIYKLFYYNSLYRYAIYKKTLFRIFGLLPGTELFVSNLDNVA